MEFNSGFKGLTNFLQNSLKKMDPRIFRWRSYCCKNII